MCFLIPVLDGCSRDYSMPSMSQQVSMTKIGDVKQWRRASGRFGYAREPSGGNAASDFLHAHSACVCRGSRVSHLAPSNSLDPFILVRLEFLGADAR